MLDKDKRIVILNVNVKDLASEDASYVLHNCARDFGGHFDDSVIAFVCAVKSDEIPMVQVVSDFPIEGHEAIKNILNSEMPNEEKLIAIKELVEIRDGE